MPKMTFNLKMLNIVKIIFIFISINTVNCYNLSPKPNVLIKDPQFVTAMPKVESSYFGFSLSLRPLGIIVGAPRAQSTLELQRNINETGAIYKCSMQDQKCSPYVFDKYGNRNVEMSDYTYDSEKRDHQWLGAAIDGGTKDTDKLLVCAPRFIAPVLNDYLMHGICYWINDTLSSEPINVKKISPLRLKTDQLRMKDNNRYYYYMLAEQGLSAHVTQNNEEFLIGAPGIHTWKGSVIRYRQKYITDDPSLSRRDVHGRRKSRQSNEEQKTYYESEVPEPEKFEQPNDSYFGYSVSSGYFDSTDKDRLMYVASAPQANEQSGEAYVFDITSGVLNKHFVFRGKQFGEYFGYAILGEDINGDGLTDVIVSAPQHSISGSFDDGAIYVFINQGRFNFERKLLLSPVHGKTRFGTTLTKLGDINHDGFNDIAVGAPFIGNGSVFIYLGSEKGLREQHSQRLDSPQILQSTYGTHMFGHGLSKGSDIDGNGFNDFAVGAPNAEAVLVYRAYPVVRILASMNSQTREIKPDQTKFKVSVCYGISTTSPRIRNQDLALKVVVDPQFKRVKFTQSDVNELSLNVSASTQQSCRMMDCDVRFSVADIFKPIELEVHYNLINGVPDSEVFCDTCAAVDPAEPKVYTERISFSTGCASDICIANLQLKSSELKHEYTLGSSTQMKVTYDVTNNGETAYLPQINITSSKRLPFSKIPPTCNVNNDVVLICDLNRGQPMAKGTKDSISIIYDVSGLTGKVMILTAEVFSTGKELTPEDNIVKDVITLNEFTEVEAIGYPKTAHINLEKVFNTTDVINNYEIKSNGPSIVNALEIVFSIPIAYKIAGSSAIIPIVNMNNIAMQAVYDTQIVSIDFYQNTTQILMNTYEVSTNSKTIKKTTDNMNSVHYDSSKMGHTHDIDQSLSDSVQTASMSHRRRRREALAQTATKDQYARIAQIKAYDLLGEDLKGTLPVNRTIVFNCNDPEMTICVRAKMRIYNFKPEKTTAVTLKYNVDLKEVNQLLIEPWEFFVILISLDVNKIGDVDGKTIHLTKKIEYNIISKHQLYGTPWWVILLAIIGGLLALALITYGMYKAGFFKRTTKEEMDKLVQQNQNAGEGENETENLNTEENRT